MGIGMTFKDLRETRNVSSDSRERFLPLDGAAGFVLAGRDVSLAGLSELRGAYEIARDSPPFHVVLFTISGKGRLETETGIETILPGSKTILPAGTRYRYSRASGMWKIAWVHLRRRRTWRALEGAPVRNLGTGAGPEVEFAMNRCLSPRVGGGSIRLERMYAELLVQLVATEIEESGNSTHRSEEETLRAVFGEVSGRLSEKWTVARLARMAHMSNASLHRATLRIYSASPMAHTVALRMERAELLLLHTPQSVAQIASEVGYENPFAFSTAFSRRFGIPPSHLRRARISDSP
jgi:AraC-like DNA-binding protein